MASQTLASRELPRWIRDLLASPPVVGTGLHQWLYRVACALKPWRDAEDVSALLVAATNGCGRDTRREIAQAIAHATSDWQPQAPFLSEPAKVPASQTTSPSKSVRDDDSIRRVLTNGFSEADLWEASPLRTESAGHPLDVLPLLFPHGDPLLCMGWLLDACRTKPHSEWLDWPWERVPLQFIVPAFMQAREGRNGDGKSSSRALSATGARQYVVIEFDFNPGARSADAALLDFAQRECGLSDVRDICASLIFHLSRFGPLALVVWSGGKSLHAWFSVNGTTEPTLHRFFDYAVVLGADPATWTRNQLVRLPWGTRPCENAPASTWDLPEEFSQPSPSKSRLQSVLYLDPSVIKPCP